MLWLGRSDGREGRDGIHSKKDFIFSFFFKLEKKTLYCFNFHSFSTPFIGSDFLKDYLEQHSKEKSANKELRGEALNVGAGGYLGSIVTKHYFIWRELPGARTGIGFDSRFKHTTTPLLNLPFFLLGLTGDSPLRTWEGNFPVRRKKKLLKERKKKWWEAGDSETNKPPSYA